MMIKNKLFVKCIVVTLLVALLTFNVGKVTRVSAVGTTIAAAAGATLCAVGIVYCSYMALTGASVHIPDSIDNIQTWLQDMGSKVVQFPAGREAYEEIYPDMMALNPATSLIHDFLDSEVWTWTSDKLKAWANDFSSVDVIQNIATYDQIVDVSQVPTNGFEYAFSFEAIPDVVKQGGSSYTFEYYENLGYTITPYSDYLFAYYSVTAGHGSLIPCETSYELRNYYDGTYYRVQQYENGEWVYTRNPMPLGYYARANNTLRWIVPNVSYLDYWSFSTYQTMSSPLSDTSEWPQIANAPVYDSTIDDYRPMVIPNSNVTVRNPQYPTLPPDDDNKPVIPYVKLPYDPNWIDPINGVSGGGNWGFNIEKLLNALESLAGLMMEIGAIGELINQFKDLMSSDNYYIYYDDSEHDETFYNYYTITNYNGDTYQYDIDVSKVDEHLPVDLNTIQQYTNNRYLDQVKKSAIAGSSILRDLVVFVYDIDPSIVYVFFGSCIAILVAAFIGKWGHS